LQYLIRLKQAMIITTNYLLSNFFIEVISKPALMAKRAIFAQMRFGDNFWTTPFIRSKNESPLEFIPVETGARTRHLARSRPPLARPHPQVG
jgi:hypothetical protein